jgi:hypothetical protein
MCKNPKKFGKKAVLVAVAAILVLSILAAPVSAEDITGNIIDKVTNYLIDKTKEFAEIYNEDSGEETTQTESSPPRLEPAQSFVGWGGFVAFKNNKEVTDVAFHKPVYLYEGGKKGSMFHIHYSPISTEEIGGRKIGGPYTTYGAVCEATDKRLDELWEPGGPSPRADWMEHVFHDLDEHEVNCRKGLVTYNMTHNASSSSIIDEKVPQKSCEVECKRLFGGKKNVEILESSGTYPNCRCLVEYKDNFGRITKIEEFIKGDTKTTYTYNPRTGDLIKKDTISVPEEKEKLRERLGDIYTEEEIDKMLDDKEIIPWFDDQMKDIQTETRLWHPQFWWQHILAIFDHGFSGNSADFVDTYKFGRCGDSMLWLEDRLAEKLHLPGDLNERQQAMLTITVEFRIANYLIADHTALLIRPKGITNSDWKEIVQTINAEAGEEGLSKDDIKQLAPTLLNARVLDPYFRESRTVEEFIKKWPTIKIG